MQFQQIPIELIDPNPWQTRQNEDPAHVEEIARSIKAMGMMQFPSARRHGERYQLAFGHTRKAAYNLLNSLGTSDEYKFMPLYIMDLTDEKMAIAAFEENEKRRELNPVDRALAVQKMLIDFGWTQEAVAEKLHIDRSGVSNMLRMLRLPEDVLQTVAEGILPVRSALALLPIFELGNDDRYKLFEKFGDPYYEFISLAKKGEINSDTIRARVEECLSSIRPEQLKLDQIETTVVEEGAEVTVATAPAANPVMPISATQTSIDDWQAPTGGEGEDETEAEEVTPTDEAEPGPRSAGVPLPVHDETNGNVGEASESAQAVAPEPTQAVESDAPENNAVQKVETPAEPPQEQIDPNEVLFTITYKTGAVIVGVKRPGNPVPTLKYLAELNPEDVPALMREMGIG